MTKANISKEKRGYHVAVGTVLLTLFVLGLVTTIYWNTTASETYTLQGKVSEKLTSCEREFMSDNGTLSTASNSCDSGNNLLINNVRIWTGGGSLTAGQPAYISDIGNIHAGDEVTIVYTKDKQGYFNTNCQTCSVTKATSH